MRQINAKIMSLMRSFRDQPRAQMQKQSALAVGKTAPNVRHSSRATQRCLVPWVVILLCGVFAGCEGKSLIDDNPVIGETPPRMKSTNSATTQTASLDDSSEVSVVKTVSHSSGPELTGNTIVAEVNGTPIFVDDLIGSMRLTLEDDSSITFDERQNILHTQIKARLSSYVDQEIVLQALRQAIPEDKQKVIRDSLRAPFQDVLSNIKRDNNVSTDDEINEILARQGLSIDLLRESFIRIQMFQGYLSSVVEVSDAVDRIEMVKYYDSHRDKFSTQERVRCQEIVIQFAAHGDRDAAEKKMAEVVRQLQLNVDFSALAVEHSDALSAEKRGDIGWLQRGSLSDKDLENTLFELAPGKMTKVYVRDDRLEVYRVVDHQQRKTAPLQEAQQQIEANIKAGRRDDARKKALDDLRKKAIVVTMYDDNLAAK